MHDVLVVGAGPAGRAVAAACAEHGLRTVVLDPAPNRPWAATFGMWADEVPAGLPDGVAGVRAQGFAVARTRHRLMREYVVLDTPSLRAHLDDRLAEADVRILRGRAVPGALPPARLVIDAGGAGQPLNPLSTRPVAAEQTAFGLMVPAEVAAPVVATGEALFMDWRPVPGAGGWPTFLYAVPLPDGRVLLEETSLARRPGLPIPELRRRLRARLAGLGVPVPDDAEREVVRFRLDAPCHRVPGVLGFGAAAPLTHPATGYQMATALRSAPVVADAIASHWAEGPEASLAAARAALWPPAVRATHFLRRRGLESLLRMPAERVPDFFEGFFALPSSARDAYLDGRARPAATVGAMAGLFRTTPWPVRLRLIGSSMLLSAPPRYDERTSGEYRSAPSANQKGRPTMGAYQKVIVGTDGSDTSMLAVDKAGALAGAASAELVIVCAYEPQSDEEVNAAADALGEDAYQVVGSAPAESVLRDAVARARAAGAEKIDTLSVQGPPVDVLDQAVADRRADLLVVGNVGLNTLTGRILGSVPQSVARRSGVDVLIVHTS